MAFQGSEAAQLLIRRGAKPLVPPQCKEVVYFYKYAKSRHNGTCKVHGTRMDGALRFQETIPIMYAFSSSTHYAFWNQF